MLLAHDIYAIYAVHRIQSIPRESCSSISCCCCSQQPAQVYIYIPTYRRTESECTVCGTCTCSCGGGRRCQGSGARRLRTSLVTWPTSSQHQSLSHLSARASVCTCAERTGGRAGGHLQGCTALFRAPFLSCSGGIARYITARERGRRSAASQRDVDREKNSYIIEDTRAAKLDKHRGCCRIQCV